MGTVKNMICKNAEENFLSKPLIFSLEYANDMAGKIAVESETANAFTTMEDKLLAKFNTAMLPVANVDAMAVIAMVFNWPAPSPNDLGAISINVFFIPG